MVLTAATPVDTLAPLLLPDRLPLTAEQFRAECHGQRQRPADPHEPRWLRNRHPLLLGMAVRAAGLLVKLYDSSIGFLLPDGKRCTTAPSQASANPCSSHSTEAPIRCRWLWRISCSAWGLAASVVAMVTY